MEILEMKNRLSSQQVSLLAKQAEKRTREVEDN